FVFAAIYGMYAIGRAWLSPVAPVAHISQSPRALPLYALYSVVRISIAYGLSLVFALAYGYIAASSRRAEIILVPLLDILQSIPVLSFLPGVMLAMVAIFPHQQIGVELGSILLIFTGQVWNIAFSFYSSLKGEPRELREAAIIYRFSHWQKFVELDLPFSTIGLVWNSMMSVAGGWFFLMACEMFVLGKRDFRLPGLGSYLQSAAGAGNTNAITWGIVAMIGLVILIDQLVWRPAIAWSDKFKQEQVESSGAHSSPVLNLLRKSPLLTHLRETVSDSLMERIYARSAERRRVQTVDAPPAPWQKAFTILAGIIALFLVLHGVFQGFDMLRGITGTDIVTTLESAGATFLRVLAALVISSAWTIPAGVAIGFNPRLARIAQPIAQIAASVPATALFPVLLLGLISLGGGLNTGSILLMLLGTQWYILFNVIAGAIAIPSEFREVASIFRFSRIDRWRTVILPAIFPYLITGLVTASGGAWNASIVAEYFHFKGQVLQTFGLGAEISSATDAGNFALLLLSTIVMATLVVSINRLVWRPLYRRAETRFRLEA
ncbi:MAG TPA: ABC transporter permease subunit, partial [Bryobacteraceae bacterium]|nr:ABC transporter permease subunit [Bryobacteraceae bacterium]